VPGSLQETLARCTSGLEGNDLDFFRRVWSVDRTIYRQRLRAAGFGGCGDVLDAGCGFGQWTAALSEMNRSVTATDIDTVRVEVVRAIIRELELANVVACIGDLEDMPFDDASFDAIFSYSAIYFTDFRKSMSEFARLLRPGGRLYIATNGLGWYVHNLLTGHNQTSTFDPKAMAIEALENSIRYYALGDSAKGIQLVTPSDLLRRVVGDAGLAVDAVLPEGQYVVTGEEPGVSFYEPTYYGLEGVYELIAHKAA